ncbi:Ankyrin repeat protein [Giardia duodenalis]|uniref:Ankyrin repeat protein n=1 Tax=Giardia intestinalis TaxID=5741 RepID=V6TAV5_GIAIN|nr:Ankyrin repeat protein [Giardia intestinalis]
MSGIGISTAQNWIAAVRAQSSSLISQYAHKYNGTRDDAGYTGLMIAASQGNTDIIRILMGYEQKLTNNAGETALILAARNGHAAVCKLLVGLEKGCKLPNGQDALMVAAQNGHVSVINAIIKHFRLVNDRQNLSAADHACATNNLDCLKALLQHFVVSQDDLTFMITVASAKSNTDILKYLKEYQSLSTHSQISACAAPHVDAASELDDDELQLHNELSGCSDPLNSQDDSVTARIAPARRSRALFRASTRLKSGITEDGAMQKRCAELEETISELRRKIRDTDDALRMKDLEITKLKLHLETKPADVPARASSPQKMAQEIESLREKVKKLEARQKGGDDFSYKVATTEIALLKEEIEEKNELIGKLQSELNSPSKQKSSNYLRGTADESYVERLEDEIMQLRTDLLSLKSSDQGPTQLGVPASALSSLPQNQDNTANCDALKEEIKSLKEEVQSLRTQLAAANKVNAHMAIKSHKSMTGESRHAQRAEVLQQIVDKQDTELKAQKQLIDDIQAKVKSLNEERDELVEDLQRKIAQLADDVRRKDDMITSLQSASSKMARSEPSTSEVMVLKEKVSLLESENSRLQAQAQMKDAQFAELTSSLSLLDQIEEKNRSNAKAEIHALRVDKQRLKDKLLASEKQLSDLKCVLEEFTIDFSGPTSTIDPGLNAKEIIALHKQLSEKDRIIEALSNNPVGMRGREGSLQAVRRIRKLELDLDQMKILAEELAMSYVMDCHSMASSSTATALVHATKAAPSRTVMDNKTESVQTALTVDGMAKDIAERDRRIQCLIAALQNQEQSFKSLRIAMDEKGKENNSVITALESSGETLKKVLSGRSLADIRSGVMTPTSGALSPRRARSCENTPPKDEAVTSEQIVPLLTKLASQQLKEAEKNDERTQASLSPRGRSAVASANATVINVLKNEIGSLKEMLHARDKEIANLRGEEWCPAEY